MSDVALRDYITEIDGMIEHSAYDTAIAHCRHILTQYPRYLEVYRTLGKAALEKEDDEAALDIFQRVLSVDPEDFVARVGLSIIYDRRNDLSKAIWHMERAFDLMPSNEVIQSELKRLYGRRDGTEPERISLTRGALARMYAQGGLYPEAIADLHSLLQEQADRIDLQVLLSEVLWRDEQPVEAAEWAQKVIAKLPYCLKANLVLGDVWQSNGQNEEGVASLKRAQAVDPDNVRAAHLFGPTSLLPYRTTTVSRMDQPSYGDMLTDASPRVEAEEVPDWLKGLADMGTPQIESPESLSAPRLPTGLHMPNTGPLQAEIPEWLLGLAPAAEPGVEATAPAAEVPDWLVAMTGPATEEAQPDWMAQLPATSEPPTESAAAAAEIPDWLSQLGASAEVEAAQPAAQEEVPDWLSQLSAGVATPTESESAAQAPAETPAEIPDWMSQLRGAAPVEPEPEAAEGVPDWLSQLQASAPSLPETEATLPASTPEAEVPDWLAGLQTPEPEPSTPTAESKAEPNEEVPDWLQSLQTLEKQAQSTVVSPHPSVLEHKIELDADRATVNRLVEAFEPKEESPAPPAAVESAAAVTEMPEAMPSADDALAYFAQLLAGKEDQLRAQAEQEGTVRMDAIMGRKSAEAAPVTPAPAPEPIVVPAPEAEVPDWLSQLTTPPVEEAAEQTPATELPGWLQSLQPFEPIEPVAAEETIVGESVAEPTPAEDLPEWLREVQSQETIAAPASASELPEWLRELQPLPSDTEPVPEETAAVESAAVAAPTPSLVMREDEEPLAYLQRLADEKQARLAGAVQPQVSEAQAAPIETPAPPVAESPAAPVAAASVAAETAASIPEAMPSADDALAFFAQLLAGKEDQLRAQAEQEATVRMDAIMGRKSAEVAPVAAVSKPEPEPQPEVKPIEAAPVAVPAESAPAAPVPVTPPVAAVKPAARRAAPKPVAAPATEVEPPAPVVEPEPSAPPPAEPQPVASATETEPASTLPASWWIQSAEDEGEEPMAELPAPYLAPRPAPSGPVMTRLKRDRSRTRELTQPAAPPPAPPTPAVVSVNLEPLLVRLQYNKNDHDARLQLARAYWAMGDRDQSLVTYAQLAAANVLTDDLMADLERVVEIYQDADWFRLLGDVYMKNSRLPRALDMYRRALTQL